MTNEPLHVKYRPDNFKDVVNQDHVVKSLQSLLASSSVPHSYLFYGPSGVGKTTLARITAYELGCAASYIREIDAATFTGIDKIREITDSIRFKQIGTGCTVLIIDEAHALSKQAMQSLLKTIEEPPSHVYFMLCTTEPNKIPETIKSRCAVFGLNSISVDSLFDALIDIVDREDIQIEDSVVDKICRASGGNLRSAISYLSQIRSIDKKSDIELILSTPMEDAEIIEICRSLSNPNMANWSRVVSILKSLKEKNTNPESIRLLIVNYFSNAVLNSKDKKPNQWFLFILSNFTEPLTLQDGYASLLLSVYDILNAE